MRHAAVYFAGEVKRLLAAGHNWDLIFCSDMLELASFYGLVPKPVRNLPSVVYFHENQLTYPMPDESQRDYHLVFANFTTGLAADQVWFNSAFNRDEFLDALPEFLKKMPDYRPESGIEEIRRKSVIKPLGIDEFPERGERQPGSLRILWAARWEHDKNPEDFFAALRLLKEKNVDFRISVIGEQFRVAPEVFENARGEFAGHIDHWGYLETREEYIAVLQLADVVVSTATHEFFGVSILEAVGAGAWPLVPNRLAYPEIFTDGNGNPRPEFFYDGSPKQLAAKLAELGTEIAQSNNLWVGASVNGREISSRFSWERIVPELDGAISHVCLPE